MTTKEMREQATPSEQIAQAAAKAFDVTDELGRVITIRKPGALANLDFMRAAGSGGEVNQLYLGMVMHLAYVAAIDGAPVVTPATEAELRALYGRLGDPGNEAAQKCLAENFAPSEGQENELKNS